MTLVPYTKPGMSNEDYHKEKKHISKSGLDRIHKSPRHFFERIEEPDNAIFLMGRATHHWTLENKTFYDKFAIGPDVRKNTNEWKEFVRVHGDRDIVTAKEFDLIREMGKSVWAHPFVAALFEKGGKFEIPIFAEMDGVKVKCRPDWISNSFFSYELGKETRVILELKTTKDADPGYFSRAIFNSYYRYHVQAAYYLDICRTANYDVSQFIFVAVEKTPPHPVCVYIMDPESIDIGRQDYQEDLETYKEWVGKDSFPGYNNDEPVIVSPPSWLIRQRFSSTDWSI